MREQIRDIERLQHIRESIVTLLQGRDNYSLDDLRQQRILFHGFVKEVEIIGEAVYKLTHEFRDTHSEVPWADIEHMRHVLVHGYYQISPEKLWATVMSDLDVLLPFIERYIKELEGQ